MVKTPAYTVELPPCHGVPGPVLGELPPTEQEAIPIGPQEPPRELPIRGKCLLDNWQEEVRLLGVSWSKGVPLPLTTRRSSKQQPASPFLGTGASSEPH